jgi:hypothetical protein
VRVVPTSSGSERDVLLYYLDKMRDAGHADILRELIDGGADD